VINWLNQSPFAAWQKLSNNAEIGIFAVPLTVNAYWLHGAPSLDLAVVFNVSEDAVSTIIVPKSLLDEVIAASSEIVAATDFFAQLILQSNAAVIFPNAPQQLQPVFIPKPWGQEIWYSGIEARGVAGITDGSGVIPLPWLLAAFPELYGSALPILLKILDPHADELLGDLYFELHQEKREVYVVTAIDEQAWPDGKGAIRFGFNQTVRQQYANDKAFSQAFLHAVQTYQVLRREIDTQLDALRAATGFAANDVVTPPQLHQWLALISDDLRQQEHDARLFMYSFTQLKTLAIGDIVKVPTLLPHSLQHGVRTIEFQTPVYERMIISFTQKVLTQNHWDTEQALPLMTLAEPEAIASLTLASGDGWQIEQVVDFADFLVERWLLEPGASVNLPSVEYYQILMLVSGSITLDRVQIENEQAVLLPAGLPSRVLVNNSTKPWIFLLAKPK
jgi:hypothetical protein